MRYEESYYNNGKLVTAKTDRFEYDGSNEEKFEEPFKLFEYRIDGQYSKSKIRKRLK
jgi:hypothetical protein